MGHGEYAVISLGYHVLPLMVVFACFYDTGNRYVVAQIINEMGRILENLWQLRSAQGAVNAALTIVRLLFAAFILSCGIDHYYDYLFGHTQKWRWWAQLEMVLTSVTTVNALILSWFYRQGALRLRTLKRNRGDDLVFWHVALWQRLTGRR